MPRMPKWIGDTMEIVFNRMITPVEVTHMEYVFPEIKRITMKGRFSAGKFAPGSVVEFRVTENDFRHYTVSAFDQEKGICEILIYLHGRGVGSKWADQIRVGQSAGLMGPSNRLRYKYDKEAHFVFGDETSLGLMEYITREARMRGHKTFCLLELDEINHHWVDELDITATIVNKDYEPAAKFAVEEIIKLPSSFWQQWEDAAFYITGRAKSIQAIRKILVSKGISMKNIMTEPYWAEGKRGL